MSDMDHSNIISSFTQLEFEKNKIRIPTNKYELLKLLQNAYSFIKEYKYMDNEKDSEQLNSLLRILKLILFAEVLPNEVGPIAAKCVVTLLDLLHPGDTLQLFQLIREAANIKPLPVSEDYMSNWSHYETELSDLQFLEMCNGSVSLPLMFVVSSVLSSSKRNHISTVEDGAQLSVIDMYPLLEVLCTNLNDGVRPYQAIELWASSLASTNANHSKISREKFTFLFSLEYKKPGMLWKFLSSNWECPIKGVSSIMTTIFSLGIRIYDSWSQNQTFTIKREDENNSKLPGEENVQENSEFQTSKPTIATESLVPSSGGVKILDSILVNGQWSSRSTYYPLIALLEGKHFTAEQMLTYCKSTLPENICRALSCSYLSQIVSSLYSLLISDLTLELWKHHFGQFFIDSLTSTDSELQRNIIWNFLPKTLKRFPNASSEILDKVSTESDSGYYAKVAVLRAQKDLTADMNHWTVKNASETTEEQSLIIRSLYSLNENVRAEAFAYLCQNSKKASPISAMCAECIIAFALHNMNIDSSTFRHSVLFSYKMMLRRIVAVMSKELKLHPLLRYADLSTVKIPDDLLVSSYLVTYFICFSHLQMEKNGNYQRKLLALQLYRTILNSFHCFSSPNEDIYIWINRLSTTKNWYFGHHQPISNWILCGELDKVLLNGTCLHEILVCDIQKTLNDNLKPINSLFLSDTIPLVLNLMQDDMADIRSESYALLCTASPQQWSEFFVNPHEVKNLSDILCYEATSSISDTDCLSFGCSRDSDDVFLGLLSTSLRLCDSLRISECESGALLLKLLLLVRNKMEHRENCSLPNVMLSHLLSRVKLQFSQLKNDFLKAALNKPLFGSILAVNSALQYCSEVRATPSATSVSEILSLCREIVLVMLSKLSGKESFDAEDTGLAPSFADMSSAIDKLIATDREKEITCLTEEEGRMMVPARVEEEMSAGEGMERAIRCAKLEEENMKRFLRKEKEKMPVREEEEEKEKIPVREEEREKMPVRKEQEREKMPVREEEERVNMITQQYEAVLSCSWQSIKACCSLTTSLLIDFRSLLSSEQMKAALTDTLLLSLVATRHKGAIDGARKHLADVLFAVFKAKDHNCISIISELLESTLSREVFSVHTKRSVTRRSAGLSMLTQSICHADAIHSKPPTLLTTTVERLLQQAQTPHQEENLMLHDCCRSISLHLLQAVVNQIPSCPHLSAISLATLSAFESTCWMCRNGALQLFGALVTRLVGQKKVSEDSAQLNCLTAPEFFSRYRVLSGELLKILQTNASSEKVSMSPALMPVLCLLSRLSPGATYSDLQTDSLLRQFVIPLTSLLSSCIHKVRTLAANIITKLSSNRDALLSESLEQLGNVKFRANSVNGHLMLVKYLVENKYSFSHRMKRFAIDQVIRILSSDAHCMFNKIVACDILSSLEHQIDINLVEMCLEGGVLCEKMISILLDSSSNLIETIRHLFGYESLPIYECVVNHLMVRPVVSKPCVDYSNVLYLAPKSDLLQMRFFYFICNNVELDDEAQAFVTKELLLWISKYEEFISCQQDERILLKLISRVYSKIDSELFKCLITFHHQLLLMYLSDGSTEEEKLCGCECLQLMGFSVDHPSKGMSTEIRIKILLCVIELLSDENATIRNLMARSICASFSHVLHPNVVLSLVMRSLFSASVLVQDTPSVSSLSLMKVLEGSCVYRGDGETNTANVYREPFYLEKLANVTFSYVGDVNGYLPICIDNE